MEIHWPEKATLTHFSILENGIGMIPAEFDIRWRTLDYDRVVQQGLVAMPLPELEGALPRVVYGRNGKGRHAAFLFSSPCRVRTWRDGLEATFEVSQGRNHPIEIAQEKTRKVGGHGTEVSGIHIVESALNAAGSSARRRSELSHRERSTGVGKDDHLCNVIATS